MKCPKCGYLGFESSDRCRHCGFDFSMSSLPPVAAAPRAADLTFPTRGARGGEGPLEDFPLREQLSPAAHAEDIRPSVASASAPWSEQPAAATDLPLFWLPGDAGEDDTPLITLPSPPRPPLVVRRATPEVPRGRRGVSRTPQAGWFKSGGDAGEVPSSVSVRSESAGGAGIGAVVDDPATSGVEAAQRPRFAAAAANVRVVAGFLDLALLAAIDLVVVYLTTRIGGVSLADAQQLPRGPLVVFLVVQNAGYLVAFTAGGQTLGKMATGLCVVANDGDSVGIWRAFLRTVAWALLAAPCGLGFLPMFFDHERRGLHDRWTGTRVVRVAS